MFSETPSRWLRIAVIFLSAVCVLLTILAGMILWAFGLAPPSNKAVVFVSVEAADSAAAGSQLDVRYGAHARVPLYLVKEGELYLRLQISQTFHAFQVTVDAVRWNAAMLAELVAQHPELRPLLPDPAAPHGGVRWLFPLPAPDSVGAADGSQGASPNSIARWRGRYP